MKKLIIGLFFVLCLFFAIPMPAQAADYNVWVGGVRVTDENKTGVTGDGVTGTVTYDSDNEILTLEDADITGVYTSTAEYYEGTTYGIYFYDHDLTINLVGDSAITVPDNPGYASEGIGRKALDSSDLVIQGTGTLTVSIGEASYINCISGGRGSVTIGGNATITITAEPVTNRSYGIFCEVQGPEGTYPITIQDNAQVTITTNSGAGGGAGLCSNGGILITGDAQVDTTVLGTSTENTGHTYGILSGSSRKLTISDQAVVTAAGANTTGSYSYSYGVSGSTVEVLGNAQLTATGGNTSGTGSNSFGISGRNGVTISDTAQVTATGGTAEDPDGASYGMGCNDGDAYKIQITGGTIQVQGGTQAFSKQPVDGSGELLDISGWDGNALVTYPPAPTYSIELDRNETHVFIAQKTGYEAQTPLTVTVTNTGNQATGDLTAALSGANADSYTLSAAVIDSIDVAGTDSFTVVPITGLAVGTYTATVTVSGGNGISDSFDVSFTVSRRSRGGGGGSNNSTDSSFSSHTDNSLSSLTHSATGIRAEGNLSGDIEVKPLVEAKTGKANELVDPVTYNELKVSVDKGYTVISAYEVRLTGHRGNLTLTFPIDAGYNGKSYVVKHRTSSGKIVSYTGTVENGKITIQVTELSPFMITILEDQITPDTKINNPFTDVGESDWFYNTVLLNLDRGLLGGTNVTTFSPNDPITRGMFTTVLARVDGADLSGYTTSQFTDVDMSKYYGASVVWAADKGIITGYGNGLFGAEDSITREQIAAMLTNYIRIRNIKIDAAKPEAVNYADDSEISSWAKNSVYIMQVHGLIGGRPSNLYDPKSIATRAEVAQVFLNYANAVK
ncbi:MAG: S-layer homology domain-containing protein [Desulfitobacteriaceae bacterium]|nr:S-layer homology domain-containing protein [Desulfitobacteriaceae bacterium]